MVDCVAPRFANVDFATISGLQRWMQCLLLISGYDINCQYRINFDKRMEWFRAHQDRLKSIHRVQFPKMLAVIRKFHLPAHNASCRYKFSYYWMPGAGMTDGEAPERIWAVLNGLACRTREMAAGHRHDIINDHHSDMNTRRTHDMGTYQAIYICDSINDSNEPARALCVKHDEALIHSGATDDEVERLESNIPKPTLKNWKDREAEYLRKVVSLSTHKDLDNPYEVQKEKGESPARYCHMQLMRHKAPSQKEMSARLNKESSGTPRTERRGLIGVLEEGIDLEELRYV